MDECVHSPNLLEDSQSHNNMVDASHTESEANRSDRNSIMHKVTLNFSDGVTKEFLVQEAISSGRSIASIARDNGINQNLLHNWKREQKAKQAPFC